MLLTGIKTPVGIKIFGSDLNVIKVLDANRANPAGGARHAQRLRRASLLRAYFTDIKIDS